MKVKNILGKMSLVVLLGLSVQSCKKENGIDNNNVIQRPYALFAADTNGGIYKSNDGDLYATVLSPDGTPLRAIVTSKNNILFVKDQTLFISINNGLNFNPIKTNLVQVPKNIRWANFILDVPQLNRVYLSNALGIIGKTVQSPTNGTYFELDTSFTNVDTPYVAESFAFTSNQILYSYSPSGSKFGVSRLFYKTGKDEKWKPRVTDLSTVENFYVSSWGNSVVATDYDGLKGAYFSRDTGKTFVQFTGLPMDNKKLYCTYHAYDRLMIGTEGKGLFLYDGANFQPSNSGIDPNTNVYSITSKENLFKNGISKKFIYIATSTGIYRSEDLAKSWIKVKKGPHTLVY